MPASGGISNAFNRFAGIPGYNPLSPTDPAAFSRQTGVDRNFQHDRHAASILNCKLTLGLHQPHGLIQTKAM